MLIWHKFKWLCGGVLLLMISVSLYAASWVKFDRYPNISIDDSNIERSGQYRRLWIRFDDLSVIQYWMIDCEKRIVWLIDDARYATNQRNIRPESFEDTLAKHYCRSSWGFFK